MTFPFLYPYEILLFMNVTSVSSSYGIESPAHKMQVLSLNYYLYMEL